MELWFFRFGKHLVASDHEAEEAVKKISQGECVLVDLKRPRNLAHLRKYWSLINLVQENQEKYPNKEHLHIAVKLAAGWYEPWVMLDGTTALVPKSIAFDKMSQDEFNVFYREAVAAIVRLLPQFKADWLLEHVSEYGQ